MLARVAFVFFHFVIQGGGMMVSQASDFCTCVDHACKRHPTNQPDGCTPCVENSIATGTIPACFYRKIDPDMDRKQDYTFAGFARFVRDHLGS